MAGVGQRKLSELEVETLIQLWHDEPCLWDVSRSSYSNQDARKSAVRKIAEKMEVVDICMYCSLFINRLLALKTR